MTRSMRYRRTERGPAPRELSDFIGRQERLARAARPQPAKARKSIDWKTSVSCDTWTTTAQKLKNADEYAFKGAALSQHQYPPPQEARSLRAPTLAARGGTRSHVAARGSTPRRALSPDGDRLAHAARGAPVLVLGLEAARHVNVSLVEHVARELEEGGRGVLALAVGADARERQQRVEPARLGNRPPVVDVLGELVQRGGRELLLVVGAEPHELDERREALGVDDRHLILVGVRERPQSAQRVLTPLIRDERLDALGVGDRLAVLDGRGEVAQRGGRVALVHVVPLARQLDERLDRARCGDRQLVLAILEREIAQ
eukprot:4263248-Prymnesium_polylepis.1